MNDSASTRLIECFANVIKNGDFLSKACAVLVILFRVYGVRVPRVPWLRCCRAQIDLYRLLFLAEYLLINQLQLMS